MTASTFNMFQDFIYEDRRLKPIHRFALLVMRNSSNGPTKMAFMSMVVLAKIMGCARETANRAVSFLKKLGYLIQGGGGRNKPVHYSVHLKTQEQIDSELSTGVMTSSHQNADLSTNVVICQENQCDKDITLGVTRTSHQCDKDITLGVTRTSHEFKEVNVIEVEYNNATTFNDSHSPPQRQNQNPDAAMKSQNQPPKVKNELLWKSGDPSFAEKKKINAEAKILGEEPKRIDELWNAFTQRVRQRSAIQPSGVDDVR